ncbi:MAG: sensor histidine kinase [Pseudohongiellaceae bacterium]
MNIASLRMRLILALVIIVTVTSTLFAGGVILIKQQLEAVIFGNMVHEQLEVLQQQLDSGTYSENSLFDNWMLYTEAETMALPAELSALTPGTYHSVIVDGNYYQVEVGERNGHKIYLTYDITDWENLEHQLLEMLAYGVGIVLLAAIFMGRQASKAVLAPVLSLAERVSGIQPKQRNVRIAEDYQGNEISLIATAFDRYQERLDQFVDRERSFTASASHELRTPLSVMIGAVDVLDSQEQNPVSKRALSRIKRACAEMLAFIEATLFLSREDSSTISQTTPVKVDNVIQSVLEDNISAAEEKGLRVSRELQSELSLQQPDSIVRIMVSNILKNAIEHTHQGEINITLAQGKLTISDTGSCIPEKDLPHIYDRSYTTKVGGTGLGLNLVKRICDRFNWQISVSSVEDKGTEVAIDFNQ